MGRNEELPVAVELQQTEARLHVLDGLGIAIQEARAVLDVVLEAADVDAARNAVQTRLGLDEIQANAVLDLQFRRTTELDRRKIEEHRQELVEHAEFLRTLDDRSPD